MAIFEVTFAKPHDFMGMIVSYSNKLRLKMEIKIKIKIKKKKKKMVPERPIIPGVVVELLPMAVGRDWSSSFVVPSTTRTTPSDWTTRSPVQPNWGWAPAAEIPMP